MLIKQPQVRIVTRPVTLENGEAALAYFALVNIAGAVEVRFLGTQAVSDTAAACTAQAEAVLALPAAFKAALWQPSKATYSAYVSPFVSTLCFLQNQLARAPSMN